MKLCLVTVLAIFLCASASFALRSGGTVSILPKSTQADTTPPNIVITSPDITRGLKIVSNETRMTVTGRAVDTSGVASVTVKGISASLDENGNFSAPLLLKPGENQVVVIAVDTLGNQKVERFSIQRKADSVVPPVPESAQANEGTFHALIIAVQSYSDSAINSLDFPIQDAQGLYDTLITAYTFLPENVTLLKNPDRATIIQTFDHLAQKVAESDSLLIFYAGHGYWDERMKQGFWLPANASKKSRAEWLSNSTIRDYINGIRSKHTLLLADACFSGGIFKTRSAFSEAPRDIKELAKLPSRKAMTSGAMKEVPDRSVFMEYLLKRLKQNKDSFISSEQLFTSFRTAVISNSSNNQIPQFGEIRETGDEGGDFIFIKKEL